MWDIFGVKTLLITFLVFAPVERLLAMHQNQKMLRPKWGIDLFYALVCSLITKAGIAGTVVAAMLLADWLMPQTFRDWVGSQSLWFQVPVVLLISDIGFYCIHRLFHKIPVLWNFHAVHHSIETLDWLAGHRVHPIDQILTKGAPLIPVFAVGFSDAAIGIYAAIYYWQSILLHSNIRLNFGPLRWIIASPQFHHWHHANQPEAVDKNFAGQFAVLDFLFKTAYLPGKSIPQRYGTNTAVPQDVISQLAFPFRAASRQEINPTDLTSERG